MLERTPHELLAEQVRGNVDDPLFEALWEPCPGIWTGVNDSLMERIGMGDGKRSMYHPSPNYEGKPTCCGVPKGGYIRRSRKEAWYRLSTSVSREVLSDAVRWWQRHPLDALCAAISKAMEGAKL